MANKTTTVTFRMAPDVKDVLREVAHRERRSVANMIEVLVMDHARRLGMEEKTETLSPKSTRGKKSSPVGGRDIV